MNNSNHINNAEAVWQRDFDQLIARKDKLHERKLREFLRKKNTKKIGSEKFIKRKSLSKNSSFVLKKSLKNEPKILVPKKKRVSLSTFMKEREQFFGLKGDKKKFYTVSKKTQKLMLDLIHVDKKQAEHSKAKLMEEAIDFQNKMTTLNPFQKSSKKKNKVSNSKNTLQMKRSPPSSIDEESSKKQEKKENNPFILQTADTNDENINLVTPQFRSFKKKEGKIKESVLKIQ